MKSAAALSADINANGSGATKGESVDRTGEI